LGRCYPQKGQYEDALAEFQKALQRAPEAFFIHGYLGFTYVLLDRLEEARASVAKARELAPGGTVSRLATILPYKNKTHIELLLDAARKVGVPE
jgi:Flp pilus assembly protein TadD